jgi:hypothetical protein
MPDFTKKVIRHCSDVLQPGESYEGAVYGQPAGSFGRSVAFGVGGVVGSVIADRASRKRAGSLEGADEGGLASTFPQGKNVVLAVTGSRFLVFAHGAMSGNPKELVVEYPLDQVHEVSQEKRRAHRSLKVRFSDNSVVDLDVAKMAKPDRFVEAFRRVKG